MVGFLDEVLAAAKLVGAAVLHGAQTTADGIHTTLGLGPYLNKTQRQAEVLTVAQLGKMALQLDNSSTWQVVPSIPAGTYVWGPVCPGPESAFNGNFATLLAGLTVRSIWQPQLLLTEDTTLRHLAGSGPAITLTGTRAGLPTSAIITTTLSGARGTWQGLATFIDGSSQAFTSGATVPLGGRGTGLVLNIATGTAAAGTDAWQMCMATAPDPTSGNPLSSNGATTSPIITVGLNGQACFETDATTYVHNNAIDMPAPPATLFCAFRRKTVPGSNAVAFGGDSGFFMNVRSLAAGGIDMFNDNAVNADAGPTANAWGLLIVSFTGTAADQIKFGAASATTGASAGTHNPAAGRALGARIDGTFGCACEFGAGFWVDGGIPANVAQIKAAYTQVYGAGLPL